MTISCPVQTDALWVLKLQSFKPRDTGSHFLQCLLERQQQQQQLQALTASTFDMGQDDGLQRELSASPLVGLLLENHRNEMIRRRALALALLRHFH
jgi:hypothetical protein